MPALDSSALSEENLIDDADLDTLVREAIAQVSCVKNAFDISAMNEGLPKPPIVVVDHWCQH